MKGPFQNALFSVQKEETDSLDEFSPSQAIEYDIQRILQQTSQQSELQSQIESLLTIRSSRKFGSQAIKIYEDPFVQIQQRSQQLSIYLKAEQHETSQPQQRVSQLEKENQQLKQQIQSFMSTKSAQSFKVNSQAAFSFSDTNIQQKISELESKIHQLEVMNAQLTDKLYQSNIKAEKLSGNGGFVKLLQLPIEVLVNNKKTQEFDPKPKIIEREVLVQVPVPIYVKNHKSTMVKSQGHFVEQQEELQRTIECHQLQRLSNPRLPQNTNLRQARVNNTSTIFDHIHTSPINHPPQLHFQPPTNLSNHLEQQHPSQQQPQQQQMLISNMCKSIRSESVDQQYLDEWQRKGLTRQLEQQEEGETPALNARGGIRVLVNSGEYECEKGNEETRGRKNLNRKKIKSSGFNYNSEEERRADWRGDVNVNHVRRDDDGVRRDDDGESAANNDRNIVAQREIIEVPVYIIKQVQIFKEQPSPQPIIEIREVIVQKPVIIETQKETIKYIEVPVETIVEVEVERVVYVELPAKEILVEVPVEVRVVEEKVVEKVVEKLVESVRMVEVPVEMSVEVPIEVPVEVVVDRPQIVEVERVKLVEIPVNFDIEKVKLIEVPVNVQVEVEKVKLIEIPEVLSIQKLKLIEIPTLLQINQQTHEETPITKYITIQTIRQVPIQIIKQVPIEIIKQIEVIKQVQVIKQIEVIKQVQVIKEVEVIKEVYIDVPREIIIEVPNEIERIVEVEVIREVPVQIIKQVEVVKEIEVVRQVEVIVEKVKRVEIVREVPVEIPIEVERIVEVEKEKIVHVDRVVEVEVEVERIVQVERIIEVPVQRIVEVQVQKIVYIDRLIEIPTENTVSPTAISNPLHKAPYAILIEMPVQTQIISRADTQQLKVEIHQLGEKVRLVQVPVIVEVERIVEVVKEVDVIKEIEVIKEVKVIKQVIRQVPVMVEYENEPNLNEKRPTTNTNISRMNSSTIDGSILSMSHYPYQQQPAAQFLLQQNKQEQQESSVSMSTSTNHPIYQQTSCIAQQIGQSTPVLLIEIPTQNIEVFPYEVERIVYVDRVVEIEIPTLIEVVRMIEVPVEVYIRGQRNEKEKVRLVEIPVDVVRLVEIPVESKVVRKKSEAIKDGAHVKSLEAQQVDKQLQQHQEEEEESELRQINEQLRLIEYLSQVKKPSSLQKQQQNQFPILQPIKMIEVSVETVIIQQVEIEKQKIVEIQVERIVEVVREVPVVIVKEVEVIREVEVIKEVEVIRQVEVIREVPIEIIKEIEIQKQIEVIKKVEVVRQVPVEILKEIEIVKEIEVIKEVPIQIFKEVYVSHPQIIIRLVEVPLEIIKQVQVPVQVIREIEVVKQVEVERVREVEVIRQVEVIKEIQVVRQVEVIRQVPIEILKEIQVQKTVLIELPIEIPIQIRTIESQIQPYIIEQPSQISELANLYNHQTPQQSYQQSLQSQANQQTESFFNQESNQLEGDSIQKEIKLQEEQSSSIKVVYVEVPMELEKIVQIERIIQVEVENVVEVDRIVEVEVEKVVYVDRLIEFPVQSIIYVKKIIEKVVEVPVDRIIHVEVEKIIQVEVQKIIEVEVEKIIEKEIEKIVEVEVQKIVEVDKIIEVEVQKIVHVEVEKIVEKEVEKIVEKEIERIVEVQVEKIIEVEVQKIVQIQVPIYIESIIEKQVPYEVQKIIEVEVEKIVQKQVPFQVIRTVEVEVQKIIEKIVKVPEYIEKVVYVQKPIEVIKYIDRQVRIDVPVEVQKIVYIERQVIRNVSQSSSSSPDRIQQLKFKSCPQSQSPQKYIAQLSDRSNEQKPTYRPTNDDQFFSGQPIEFLGQLEEQQEENTERQSMIERLEESERRMNEENSYLREKLLVLTESIMEKDEEVMKMKREIKRLKDRLEQESESQESTIQQTTNVEQQLRRELAVRANLERRMEVLQLELASNKKIRDEYERETHLYRQKYHLLQTQHNATLTSTTQKDKQLDYLEKQLQQKTLQLQELNNIITLMNDHVTSNKTNEQYLVETNRRLEDENVELRARVEEVTRGRLQEEENEAFEKQASLEFDRQRFQEEKAELEGMYRQQIENILNKYSKLVEENKKEIDGLERCVNVLQQENQALKQKQSQVQSSQQQNQQPEKQLTHQSSVPSLQKPTKNPSQREQKLQQENIKLTKIIDSLSKENQQLKKDLQILGESESVGSSHLKSFSFSQHNNNSKDDIGLLNKESEINPLASNPPAKKQSTKIRIQEIKDIKNDLQNEELISRLASLVKDYQQEMEKKEADIAQMKKLLCSYEAAIQDLQKERNSVYSNNRPQTIRASRSQHSNSSQAALQANVYISTLLRKLSLCEQHLNRQRAQKLRLSIRMRDLQRQLQEQILARGSNQYYGEDDELLEQVVFELESEKNKNQELRNQVGFYKAELDKAKYGYAVGGGNGVDGSFNLNLNQSNNPLLHSFEQPFSQPELDILASNEYYDTQTLIQQVKIYKLQYFKVLQWNKKLKMTILELEEALDAMEQRGNQCEEHYGVIEQLGERLRKSEEKIADLEQELDFAYESSTIQVPTSNFQERRYSRDKSPHLRHENPLGTRPEHQRIQRQPLLPRQRSSQEIIRQNQIYNRTSSERQFMNTEFVEDSLIERNDEQSRNPRRQSHRRSSSRLDPNKMIDANLEILLTKQLPLQTKYFLTVKLLEFGLQLVSKSIFESLCPQKLYVLYFNPNTPQNMKLTKTSLIKGKQKVKLYQAPQVLVGQNESQQSYVWTFGILIDLIFHEKLYYEKFADILAKKENYRFLNEEARDVGEIVERMVVKERAGRMSLTEAYQRVVSLLV